MKSLFRLCLALSIVVGSTTPAVAQSFLEGFEASLDALVESFDTSGCRNGAEIGEVPGYGSLCFVNQGTVDTDDDYVITVVYNDHKAVGYMIGIRHPDGFLYAATELGAASSNGSTGGFVMRGDELVGLYGNEEIAIRHISDIDAFMQSLNTVFEATRLEEPR